ncbi:MAG: hypothetical protein EP330_01295 [Deltaproteobacteria bacterium]|nr:MAG: hypothetical protein EP330_01295 [Deltaproteobacteria bacterium]
MTRLSLLALALVACQSNPNEATFTQNVGSAFQECRSQEVRFLAGKHNFMTAFDPCGSNNFQSYAWSPEGTHLYFQLTQSGHIMNAEAANKATITLPTETPVGPAAWITATRLVVPVQAAEGSDSLRMAVFDNTEKAQLLYVDAPGVTDIADTARGDSPSQVLFTATRGEETRKVYQLDLDDGSVSEPWPWLGPVTSFTYTPAQGLMAVGREDKVELIKPETEEVVETYTRATRGVLHKDGKWLALEHEGDAVSIFYQRAWDELSPQARERELRRAEAWEERLPEWYPKEVHPPTITVVDREKGERWMFTGFHGHAFSWYEAADFYASVILWGFEGKELNRNVVLGNLGDRLRSVEKGEEMFGLTRFVDNEGGAKPTTAEAEVEAAAEAEPAGEWVSGERSDGTAR